MLCGVDQAGRRLRVPALLSRTNSRSRPHDFPPWETVYGCFAKWRG
jgi:hypothetical protein